MATLDRPDRRLITLAAATLLLLGLVALGLWLVHGESPDRARVLAAAAWTAAGTMGMALLLFRLSPYPVWAYFGSAAILAASALASVWIIPDPARWASLMRGTLWLFPWFPLMLAAVTARGREGSCVSSRPWAGWLLIAVAVFLGTIPLMLWTVARRF